MIIKEWNEDDQPREKLFSKGSLALSDAELLAIVIGSGNKEDSALSISRRILSETNHNLGVLSKYNVQHLIKFRGIGKAKAILIIAALELGRRGRVSKNMEKAQLCS